MIFYKNKQKLFFLLGRNTKNFTITKEFLINYFHIECWRFEVVYIFDSTTSSSALDFHINFPPKHGFCSINPRSGTTNTLFNISCEKWFDEDEIKDYSVYGRTSFLLNIFFSNHKISVWSNNPSKRLPIAVSVLSNFQVRLPSGNNQTSELNMIIHVRDKFDCITPWNMSSVVVEKDKKMLDALNRTLQSSTTEINKNPLIKLLASGNQNVAGQIITIICQELNQMNRNYLYDVHLSK